MHEQKKSSIKLMLVVEGMPSFVEAVSTAVKKELDVPQPMTLPTGVEEMSKLIGSEVVMEGVFSPLLVKVERLLEVIGVTFAKEEEEEDAAVDDDDDDDDEEEDNSAIAAMVTQ